jgi:hypothetical protein
VIDPENEAQWKAEWERHHFGQCDCDQQVEERTPR